MIESAPNRGFALFAAFFAMALAIAPAAAQGTAPSPPSPAEPDEEAVFLSVIEDVPLMPGLIEDETRAIVFDAAAGRLAETYAQGRLAARAVLEFYGETLPALGWRAEESSRWVREGEALTLEPKEGPGGVDVRFYLSPARPDRGAPYDARGDSPARGFARARALGQYPPRTFRRILRSFLRRCRHGLSEHHRRDARAGRAHYLQPAQGAERAQ